MIFIGIDPGCQTGFAIWNSQENRFDKIETISIVIALMRVSDLHKDIDNEICVIVEDARKRKWFGNAGREKLQGAGSIKRDCQIWEEFLTEFEIPFEMVAPKNNRTKLTANTFKAYTKWEGSTNQHGRDAAMLVLNRKTIIKINQ